MIPFASYDFKDFYEREIHAFLSSAQDSVVSY